MIKTVTTRGQGCDRSLVKAKRFHVAIENCSVKTGFHGVASQQGILCHNRVWPRPMDLCCDRAFYVATELVKFRRNYVAIEHFMSRQSFGQHQRVSCHDKIFLSRDKVWPRQEILGRDGILICRDKRSSRLKSSMLRHMVLCCDKGWSL